MGKDYWYIIALSAAISMITISLHNYFVFLLFFLWLVYLFSSQKINLSFFVLALISFFFFYYHIPTPDSFVTLESKEGWTELFGKITSPVTQTDKKIEFTFQAEQLTYPVLALYFIHDETISQQSVTQLQYGASCRINGQLSSPDEARNPHQFDYQLFLLQKGIPHQIILSNLDDIECTPHSSMLQWIYSLRHNLFDTTSEKLDPDITAWLHALVLGEDGLIDDTIIKVFQRWSLSHILAISGLHIGIVVTVIYFILVRFQIVTKEKAQGFILLFLPVYAILAGSQPSVWRATLMIIAVIILSKLKLKYSAADIISIVFILLIIIDKHIVYHLGFQFSFAVTFGLIVSRKWIAQSKTNIEQILQISFVAQMVILPLQINYFFIFQPLSILLNVIIVPYFSLFVIPSLFILLIGIAIKIPSFFIHVFEFFFLHIHQFILKFIIWVDQYLNYPLIIGSMPLHFTLLYYLLFVLLMICLESGNRLKSFQYGVCLALFLAFLAGRAYFSPVGTVTMLDIGQGDAFVIELPYRKGVFLIDAGASFTFPNMEATDKVFNQIIKPYLYGRGIHKIDAIFISHEDLDHDGSVGYLIDEMHVDELIVSTYYPIEEAWSSENIAIHIAEFNEKIIRNGLAFYVLSPRQDKKDANENSLVLYTELGGMSWIFTGDIGKETEMQIVNNFRRLNADVLKVGHHGSNTSTNPTFIKETMPKYALISAGVNNTYGHPTNEVIETLVEHHVIIYRTDEHGAVQYHFKDNRGHFESFLQRK